MIELAQRAPQAAARSWRRAQPLAGLVRMGLFWAANLAVGASTFVVLAFLAHRGGEGRLAAASAVLALVTVVAVVPGAVQLRATAAAAAGTEAGRAPWRLGWWAGALVALFSPALAAALSLPVAAVLLIGGQVAAGVPLGAARGALIGRGDLGAATRSFAVDAAGRTALGAALGAAAGATGLAAAIAAATALALALAAPQLRAGRGAAEPARAVAGAALSLGAIALLANVDLLVAPRALGPHGADAYAVAAVPAKGIFFALFALSWLAAGNAVGRPRTWALLRPPAAAAAAGLLGAGALVVARPLLDPLLGRGVPAVAVLALTATAMALAAATSVALAMAVARNARAAWAPALSACLLAAAAATVGAGGPAALAAVVLAAQAVALAGTLGILWASGGTAIARPAAPWGDGAAAVAEPVADDEPVREPPDADGAHSPARRPPVPWRPLAAGSLLLLAACLAQAPGRLLADTKLDLAIDPARFLQRALHLWDAQAAFGQLQNQAVGYLFPIGPFFAAAHAVGAPMWIAQRVWIALILSAALWGAALLARALGIGRPAGWVVAGTAYALSPFFVGQIGATSAAVLPAAVLPWTMLPLVAGARTGSPRRAAAWSGASVLLMGGVNAVSTGAGLLVPALYLVTRPRSRRRTALGAWWLVSVALACTWWLVPLAFQGRYGLDFLHFTETSAVTEATTSLLETLRGAGAWLMYLRLGDPWLPAGWTVATAPAVIVGSSVLAAAGLAGLASRRALPERRFLALALGVGTVCVAAGYSGDGGGVLADPLRQLLAEGLGPLRNVAKFEPVLRLPLVLGLAHLLALPRSPRVRGLAAGGALTVALAGALPMLQGDLAPRGAFRDLPVQWRQTAAFLAEHAADARALVVPAAPFGEYRWGRTMDEPLQPLARSPWATRDLIPLGGIGSTRLLDVVEHQLVDGRPSHNLAALLARAGVRYVVARNDLDWARTGSPRPVQVHDTLAGSGLRRVAAFGPWVPAPRTAGDAPAAPDGAGRDGRLPSVEIFATGHPAGGVSAPVRAGTTVVSGGPDAVAQLVDRDGGAAGPAVLSVDRPLDLPLRRWFVGDALRRRDTDFGLVHDSTSYTLAGDEQPAGIAPGGVRQLLPERHAPLPAMAQLTGVLRVSASSYGSELRDLPELRPDSAFDGDPATAWVAGNLDGSAGEWVQADLRRPLRVTTLRVRALADGPWRPRIRAVTVTTEAGSRTVPLRGGEGVQTVPAVPGVTRFVRITLASVTGEGRDHAGAGLRDVAIPGVVARRYVAMPEELELVARSAATRLAPTFAFDRLAAAAGDPLRTDEEPQLLRLFWLGAPARLALSGTIQPRPGRALDALLTRDHGLTVAASSTWASLPRWRAANAVDGSAATTWMAAAPAPASPQAPGSAGRSAIFRRSVRQQTSPVPADVDPRPALTLRWRGTRTLDRVRVVAPGSLASPPRALHLATPEGVRDVPLRADGTARFRALRTDRVVVTFPRVARRYVRSAGGHRTALPVGLRELDFPALRAQRPTALPAAAPVRVPCGAGPSIVLRGQRLATRVDARAGDLVALRSLPLEPCGAAGARGGVLLPAGPARLRTGGATAFAVDRVTLRPAAAAARVVARRERAVRVLRWSDQARTVRVGPGPAAYLAVNENANDGWQATLGGRRLRAVQLDGWKQGFELPAGAGSTIALRYAPDRPFRLGLLLGALLALLLLPLALVPARRQTLPASEAPGAVAPAGRPARLLGAALIAAATALVSWPALAALPVLAVLARRRPALLAPVAAGALAAAAVITAVHVHPWPGDHGGAFGLPAQLLAAVGLAAVLVAASSSERTEP